ncbi:MAG: hypothetical protein IIU51_07835, partial [Bacteroidaceae bacterium]|nr:hypothetical protein [Bacteroidaceae bacterium]
RFFMRCNVFFIRFSVLNGHKQMPVVLLQLGTQKPRLILFFPQVLKADKANNNRPGERNELQE